jgi:hypothetical protein
MNGDELQELWGCSFHVNENREIVISLNTKYMVFLADCGFQLNPCIFFEQLKEERPLKVLLHEH